MMEVNINPLARPCLVSSYREQKRKALFHRWFEQQWTVGAEVTIGGRPAGQMSRLYAIVEYEDGTVGAVDYPCITFAPADFNDYSWGWCE
jgi:RecB family exonuclease